MALWREAMIERDGVRQRMLLKGADGSELIDLHEMEVWDASGRREVFKGSCASRAGRTDEQVLQDYTQGMVRTGWVFLVPFSPAPVPSPEHAQAVLARQEEFWARLEHALPELAEQARKELENARRLAEHWDQQRKKSGGQGADDKGR